MSLKTIQLTIPDNKVLQDMSCFSPEENYLILKIGSDCLLEGRKVVIGLTQTEIYEKIKNESKEARQQLELDIIIERETAKRLEERCTKIYDAQLLQTKNQYEKLEEASNAMREKLEETNKTLREKLKTYEMENELLMEKEIKKVKDKFDSLLDEKDKQNHLNREIFEKAEKLLNKNRYMSSCEKGGDGEDIFENIAVTFKDFTNYKIENKSKQNHKGDFHLFFEDFNVLVDCKNYSSSVYKKEVEKIESDLMTNDDMNFAWLVSLESDISGWNRFQIMNKWIMTDKGLKCIIFINNLLDAKYPKETLRLAWTMCNEYNHLINNKNIDTDNEELKKYRERDFTIKTKIKKLQDRSAELKRNINGSLSILRNIDNDILDAISIFSNEIMINECAKYLKTTEWWNTIIEYSGKDEDKLISTDIWNRFKKEHKEYIVEKNITIEGFKNIIYKIVGTERYFEKTKKGAVEIIGFKFKDQPLLEVELKPKNKKEKPKKIVKVKKNNEGILYYFNKEEDEKIIAEYNSTDKDIMVISSENNIRPWQVVSLLLRHKIIQKRDDSRGYDVYKETDEYKSKILIKK